jgi:hypothetical protein
MRYFAKQIGLHLSDKTLQIVTKNAKRPTFTDLSAFKVGDSITCSTEADIFAAFGIPYVPPNERSTYEFPSVSSFSSPSKKKDL